ncbi:pyruvate synthase subunit beta [Anaerotignum lactatifermentans]|uniref:Pyruvate synthase subunit beta n=1 Tax=Anaerotignum lactatifermentans TaxID=160404 RepID=A0ABS2GCU7_9FIRM|nr:thiamine pyrophosphate-dependent enzyme [Anaerotignum lactatifermentans]MBM6830449.1 pyruvate synthase subunit beta [Anaerotignum lactatifermentans]MBM6878975.1 pyruvate synthase subunit beta [Anaerotignum lactatifermentans]MBM6952021.1 pyruvate synthase subunit beta [Anaerotignum lactatifermentans]
MAINLKNMSDQELIYGAKTCQGCGAIMAARMAMKILGEKTCLATPACCFAATTTVYPQSAIFVNNVITAFPALAATASGMAVAAEAMGWGDDVNILALAGDGGTVDIGLQGLSGAAERNDNIIYICYDNEAYMNTGVQRSASTPYGSWTTTTPTGPCSKGEKNKIKKNLFEIMIAHRVPYAATASVAYPIDFMEKVEKARKIKGCKVIHVSAPCPTGWGYDPSKTVEIGKKAVEAGLWQLAEWEGSGKPRLTYQPKELSPVEPYLKMQKRFKHLQPEDIQEIQELRDAQWQRIMETYDK